MKTATKKPHSINLKPWQVQAANGGRLGMVVVTVKPANLFDGKEAILARFPRQHGNPLGHPGDVLLGREAWADVNTDNGPAIIYRADKHVHYCIDDACPVEYERYPGCQFAMWCDDLIRGEDGHRWRSASTMPAWAVRHRFRVIESGVKRVHKLTDAEVRACGIPESTVDKWRKYLDPRDVHCHAFGEVWDADHGKACPFRSNPWCWWAKVEAVK